MLARNDIEIARRFQEGASISALSRAYRLHRGTIYRLLIRLNVLKPRLKRLDKKVAKEVIAMRLPPNRWSTARLANIFELEPFQVRYIINRWRHGILLPDFRPASRIRLAKTPKYARPSPAMQERIKNAVHKVVTERNERDLQAEVDEIVKKAGTCP